MRIAGLSSDSRIGRRQGITRRRPIRLSRRSLIIAVALGWAILAVGAAWIIVTAVLAAREAHALRQDVAAMKSELSAGDLSGVQSTGKRIESRADRLAWLTSGPAWAVASRIPYAGGPLETVRGASGAMSDLASEGVSALTDAAQALNPADVRHPDGSFDVERILGARAQIDQATDALDDAVREIHALPAHTWSSAADRARAQLLDELQDAQRGAVAVRAASSAAPALLGEQAPVRYFIAFQNDAEARGTGGLPGAFAILEVDRGAIHFTQFESDDYLFETPTGVDLGREFDASYAAMSSTSLYVNSNISAHFPYAAQIWAAMWQARTGQQIDAAIAIDPTALSFLLNAAGAVTLPGGQKVTGANVVQLTQEDVYARFAGDQDARKAFLVDLARTVSEHLLGEDVDPTALVRAAAKAVGERRILLWSSDPAVEAAIEPYGLSGSIPQSSDPYAGFTVNNAGGNKLDYYLDRSMEWSAQGCGPSRTVVAQITLTNNAPSSGLSDYVAGRLDDPPYPVARGDNLVLLSYYATRGAQLLSATLDGQPAAGVNTQLERGHSLVRLGVELPIGQPRTITLTFLEPDSGAPLHILKQPLVRPLQVDVREPVCGG